MLDSLFNYFKLSFRDGSPIKTFEDRRTRNLVFIYIHYIKGAKHGIFKKYERKNGCYGGVASVLFGEQMVVAYPDDSRFINLRTVNCICPELRSCSVYLYVVLKY